MIDDELVRETIANLERARAEERALRLQAEGVAEALLCFAETGGHAETLARICEALAKVVGAEAAFVIAFAEDGRGAVLASTDPRLADAVWQVGPTFTRALAGRPSASFDLTQVVEWRSQPHPLLAGFRSAIHAPLMSGDLSALIEIVHPVGAFFDARHVGLIRRLLPPAGQALARARVEEAERDLIEHQRAAIRALSMPILEVWTGVLCVPVVGFVDEERCAQMTGALLSAVAATGARAVILDVTGIDRVEAATFEHFLRVAAAVRLLGGTCALTGIGPEVARMIVGMGVEGRGIVIYRRLRDALRGLLR